MHLEQLRHHLESLEYSRPLLQSWKFRDIERGWRNLSHVATAIGLEALRDLCPALGRLLPRCPDPDMALNNLERFLATPPGRESLPTLLEGRARSLEILLQLLSTSQFFSDLLVANPDYLDMLRVPLRRSPSQKEMQEQLQGEVDYLKIQYLSSDEVLNEAKDLYERWSTLEMAEKRNIVDTITKTIIVGNDDVSINLSYMPSSAELTTGMQHNVRDSSRR